MMMIIIIIIINNNNNYGIFITEGNKKILINKNNNNKYNTITVNSQTASTMRQNIKLCRLQGSSNKTALYLSFI